MLIGYFRVSTQKQSVEGHALERYEESLLRYGVLPENLYSDVESGGSITRDGFQRLCDRIEKDVAVSKLVVPSQSRLHRDLEIWVSLRSLLLNHNVSLIDLERGAKAVDLHAIATTLDAAIAEEYRIINKRRALDGHRHRRSKNRSCTTPFGYSLDSEGACCPNHNQYHDTGLTYWQAAQQMIATYLETHSLKATAKFANQKWPECKGKTDHPSSGSGVRTWLKNKTLQGHLVYFGWRDYLATNTQPKEHEKKQILYNHHQALITPTMAAEIDQLLSFARAPRGKRHRLAGLVFCGECGRKLERRPVSKSAKTKQYEYLRCQNAYPQYGQAQSCSARIPHRYLVIENLIIAEIMRNSELVAKARATPASTTEDPRIIQLENEIKTLRNISGTQPLIDEKLKTISALKGSQDRSVVDLEKQQQIQEAAATPEFWEVCDFGSRAVVFRTLLERVTVGSDGSVDVSFKSC